MVAIGARNDAFGAERCSVYNAVHGHVAELVYAYDSESYSERIGSSSLPMPTLIHKYTRWVYE